MHVSQKILPTIIGDMVRKEKKRNLPLLLALEMKISYWEEYVPLSMWKQ